MYELTEVQKKEAVETLVAWARAFPDPDKSMFQMGTAIITPRVIADHIADPNSPVQKFMFSVLLGHLEHLEKNMKPAQTADALFALVMEGMRA